MPEQDLGRWKDLCTKQLSSKFHSDEACRSRDMSKEKTKWLYQNSVTSAEHECSSFSIIVLKCEFPIWNLNPHSVSREFLVDPLYETSKWCWKVWHYWPCWCDCGPLETWRMRNATWKSGANFKTKTSQLLSAGICCRAIEWICFRSFSTNFLWRINEYPFCTTCRHHGSNMSVFWCSCHFTWQFPEWFCRSVNKPSVFGDYTSISEQSTKTWSSTSLPFRK